MKTILIYSIVIYLIFSIMIIKHKPSFLYEDDELKSWNYFKDIIHNGVSSTDDIICLPTVLFIVALFSFLIARYLVNKK